MSRPLFPFPIVSAHSWHHLHAAQTSLSKSTGRRRHQSTSLRDQRKLASDRITNYDVGWGLGSVREQRGDRERTADSLKQHSMKTGHQMTRLSLYFNSGIRILSTIGIQSHGKFETFEYESRWRQTNPLTKPVRRPNRSSPGLRLPSTKR